MKVLVIGSGGREHALCWKLRQSSKVDTVYCAPGNPGIAEVAENVSIAVHELDKLAAFAERNEIALTVVGPEYPLTLGIVDRFKARGLRIFGPCQAAAQLEGSKAFAKEVMVASGVPTASHVTVTGAEEARLYLSQKGVPCVLKADGLAAGKGVFVCQTLIDAQEAVSRLFGELRCEKIVIEEFLSGREASFIVATNGVDVIPLAAAHDYKRLGDNNTGPNTGGMGSVSPTPVLSAAQESWAVEHVIKPVLAEMRARGAPFSGFLYAGLMVSEQGVIKVLEFNARCGDPETQVIMRRLESDLFDLLFVLSDQPGVSAAVKPARWLNATAVCVVMAARGYPWSPSKGDVIQGLKELQSVGDCMVFHAGTALDSDGRLVTAGGRVLNVTAVGRDVADARSKVYRACDMIKFNGAQRRLDIGAESD